MTPIRGTSLLLCSLSLAVLASTFLTLPSDGEVRAQQQTTPNCSAGAVTDTANTGLTDDCVALLTAKDTLRGTASLDWDENTLIDDWDGITLSTSTPKRVSYVVLPNRGLNGTIPSSLGNLTNLQQLRLDDNDLSGSIPSTLGNLTEFGISVDQQQPAERIHSFDPRQPHKTATAAAQ